MKRLGVVGTALITANILGILFLAIVARYIDPDDNARFIAIWGLLFAGASIVSFIEQETARQVVVSSTRGRDIPRSVIQIFFVALIPIIIGMVLIGLSSLGIPYFGQSVLRRLGFIALICAALIGLAVQFLYRGIFLGSKKDSEYVVIIVGESSLRILALLALALIFSFTVETAVYAMAAGSLAWLLLGKRNLHISYDSAEYWTWNKVISTVALMCMANGFVSLLLTGYPALVTIVIGSTKGLAEFFSIVTVSRMPLVLLSPVQALVVPYVTSLIVSGRKRDLTRLVNLGIVWTLAGMLTLFIAGYYLGPLAIRIIFGANYIVDALPVALVFATTALIAASLLQAATLLSLQCYKSIVCSWGFSVFAAICTMLLVDGGTESKAMYGFVAASIVAYFLFVGFLYAELVKKTQSEAPRTGKSRN